MRQRARVSRYTLPKAVTELERLFHEALALPAESRTEFIRERCGADTSLAADVQALLRHSDVETGAFTEEMRPVAAELFAPAELPEGSMLGPYRIEGKIGEGGMGVVYEAIDTRLNRKVAIKMLRQPACGSETALARFHSEARASAALSHPNIIVLHDFGETDGAPWLVMELVDGDSLRVKLQTGPVEERAVLRYAGQLAAALEHAHSRGIVHRDIKPENILIAADGTLKIIDFGIAELGSRQGSRSVMGTPAYLAPELLRGEAPTAASDVYSYGAVVRELASGRAILSELIGRCLAADPALRYRNGGRLAAALRLATNAAPPAPPSIAIQDFSNVAEESSLAWLGAGIAETLASRLAKLRTVRVLTGAMRHQPEADWTISGSYQASGGAIRVTPRLLETATGKLLAAETIDGQWEEVFQVQDRVANFLASAISAELGGSGPVSGAAAETRNLIAFEQYSRGRQQMHQMRPGALTSAMQHFEEALALDPDYALAHSALGTCYALRFLQTSNPGEIQRAAVFLEKAIALDPELGEPYPWLANIRSRRNDLPGAFEAGRKGVELQPDLAEAHYFYGGLHYMFAEAGLSETGAGIAALRQATKLQPAFHPAWLILGALHSWRGEHAEAIPVLKEGIRWETEASVRYRFTGARVLLATAYFRSGEWGAAAALFQEALQVLGGEPEHLYRECFRVLGNIGAGDCLLRAGDAAGALEAYRAAWRIPQEHPRIAGSTRLGIRAAAGLAGAYAATGETARARELLLDAEARLPEVKGQLATVTFECGIAQVHLSMAAAYGRLAEATAAKHHVECARGAGWSDGRWLRIDPELHCAIK